MSELRRRLWGIDLIAAIYGLATLALLVLFIEGSRLDRLLALVIGPLTALICLGILFRVNLIRLLLMALLMLAVVGDCLLIVYYGAVLWELVPPRPNKDAAYELFHVPARLAGTGLMLCYLWRPEVRDAFLGQVSADEFDFD